MKNIAARMPTIFVILGATGDLTARKITPALFHLYKKNKLPRHFKVVGQARRPFSDGEFRKLIKENLTRRGIKKSLIPEKFLNLFSYQPGDFNLPTDYYALDESLKKIDRKWGICANKLFYLAVPPELYEKIFVNLASSGLTAPCSPEEGWTRVIVEKPFGKDLRTAEKLDAILGKLFREEQIYRIDHYLAKEMLQNILAFRFANTIFEESWNNKFIEKVNIRLLETIGVEDRGAFYDGVGALRDVGQNHLLQMLALIAMEHPVKFTAENIRKKRAEVLKTLKTPSLEDIKNLSLRAQYEGYRKIKGVAPDSKTETYFKIPAELLSPRFEGVPFMLESGKRIGKTPLKEIEVVFRHPSPCLCPPGREETYRNSVVFMLEPEEGIKIKFWSKKPGSEFAMEERDFAFRYRERQKNKSQYTEEYEKLLWDCIAGDQTLFISTEEVRAMWRFIEPFLHAWSKNAVPLKTYKPNSDEATEAMFKNYKS